MFQANIWIKSNHGSSRFKTHGTGRYNHNLFLGVLTRSSQGIAERPLPCNYPDGTLPALSHAPFERGRMLADGCAFEGASPARRGLVSRLERLVGARRIPRTIFPARQSLHAALAFLAAGAVVAGRSARGRAGDRSGDDGNADATSRGTERTATGLFQPCPRNPSVCGYGHALDRSVSSSALPVHSAPVV